MIGAAFALLRGLPWWLYAGAALLAWGAVQRHKAVEETKRIERAKTAQVQADLEQTRAAAKNNQEINDAATRRTTARQAQRRAADAAGNGLRISAAAFAASASAGPADRCDATRAAARVLADMLASVEDRGRRVAEIADERRDAGLACQQFQTVRPP